MKRNTIITIVTALCLGLGMVLVGQTESQAHPGKICTYIAQNYYSDIDIDTCVLFITKFITDGATKPVAICKFIEVKKGFECSYFENMGDCVSYFRTYY